MKEITIKNYIDMQIDEVKKDICDLKKSNDVSHTEIKNCIGGIEYKIDKLGGKFASKKIETLVYAILGFIFITLFGIIGYLLDKFVFS